MLSWCRSISPPPLPPVEEMDDIHPFITGVVDHRVFGLLQFIVEQGVVDIFLLDLYDHVTTFQGAKRSVSRRPLCRRKRVPRCRGRAGQHPGPPRRQLLDPARVTRHFCYTSSFTRRVQIQNEEKRSLLRFCGIFKLGGSFVVGEDVWFGHKSRGGEYLVLVVTK